MGEVSRRAGPILWVCALVLLSALAGLPGRAFAIGLDGSLSWDFARTASRSTSGSSVQNSFGQTYRLGASGALLTRHLATWTAGSGWRRDLTSFSGGVSTRARDVRITDFDVGLVLLPDIMPMSISFRRSIIDNKGGATVGSSSLSSTVSVSTRVRMPDGEPLSVTASQTTQNLDVGSDRSRLATLAKRFNLGHRNVLQSSYRFSEFTTPVSREVGHGISLSDSSTWTDTLSSNLFGNISSRTSSTTRRTGGRSLFVNNSFGGTLFYRRSRVVNASLAYSFSESPQDQQSDIRNHLLNGRAHCRARPHTRPRSAYAPR